MTPSKIFVRFTVVVISLIAFLGVSAPAFAASSVSGTVTLGEFGSLPEDGAVRVTAYNELGGTVGSTLTDSQGRYVLNVGTSPVILYFKYLPDASYLSEYWNSAPVREHATFLQAAQQPIVDVVLDRAATISGTIRHADGSAAVGATVSSTLHFPDPLPSGVTVTREVKTDTFGYFTLTGLHAGDHRVRFYFSADEDLYWGGTALNPSGEELTLDTGEYVGNVVVKYAPRMEVRAELRCPICGTSSFKNARWSASVDAQDPETGQWRAVDFQSSDEGWTIPRVQLMAKYVGTYRVSAHYVLGDQWGSGVSEPFLLSTETIDEITIEMTRPTVERISGATRFVVSAKASQGFDPGVPVVYIANGLNYPDALSAGPAAAHEGGPLLLVEPSIIPGVVRDELDRLDPERIVIVGGPNSVGTAVESQLAAFAPVTRVSGANRYEVSRNLALDVFGVEGAAAAYLATGRNFPDALSAGAAAGIARGPVLVVDGTAPELDAQTREVLATLGVRLVSIVGGPVSVSTGIQSSLNNLQLEVNRYEGANRYEVSSRVANFGFDGFRDVVYLAVGTKYADALSGGPVAAMNGGPLIVIPSDCVPRNVIDLIANKRVQKVVILGGTASIHASVEQFAPCAF